MFSVPSKENFNVFHGHSPHLMVAWDFMSVLHHTAATDCHYTSFFCRNSKVAQWPEMTEIILRELQSKNWKGGWARC